MLSARPTKPSSNHLLILVERKRMALASLRVIKFGGNKHYATHGLVQGLFAVSVGAESNNGRKHRIGPLFNRPVNVGASIIVSVLGKRRPSARHEIAEK
jgi:hypothetical protein